MRLHRIWLFVLLIAGLGLPAGQVSAQAKPRTVVRCEYTTHDGVGKPYLYSKPFTVEGEAYRQFEAMGDEWFAMLKAKHAVAGFRSDARCYASPESSLRYVIELLGRSDGTGTLQLDWMPAYGAPYAPPREMYYFCVAPEEGLARQFVTDLFKAPTPASLGDFIRFMDKANSAHASWMRGQGMRYYTTNMRCDAIGPEPFQAYAARLDGMAYHRSDPTRYALTRSPWPGVDPVAAPNLIDDLDARARYAKKLINAPIAAPKAAPPTPPAAPKTSAAVSKPALTIKADTGLKDAGKAWDEQVKKTLAEEAQKKVETAAKAAQADAKRQAEIDAFFAERRKQGRAQ